MKIRVTIAPLLLTLCMLFMAAPNASAATQGTTPLATLVGQAFGSAYAGMIQASLGVSTLNVGPLFPATLSCQQSSNTVDVPAASATLGTLGSLGALNDKVVVNRTSSQVQVTSSSDIANVNLPGLVTADAIHATVSTTSTGSTPTATGSVTFVNLAVLGHSVINGSVAPNTVIKIPGIGKVTLNEQNFTSGAGGDNVNAIDIQLSTATLGLPIGAHIIIAHVKSGFVATPSTSQVNAKAYGLLAKAIVVGNPVTSGPFGQVIVGCLGGNKSATVTNNTLNLDIPGVGSVGTIKDTAVGMLGPSFATSSSTVQSVQLLPNTLFPNGIINLGIVTATATDGPSGLMSSVKITSGTILGIAVPINPAPNTTITLPGLGSVTLNEVTILHNKSKSGIFVNAVHIRLNAGPLAGLDLVIAHAEASINK